MKSKAATGKKRDNRGGSGRGQGRHPITPGEPKERVFPMLRQSIKEYILKIGKGNLSRGIEILVERDIERTNEIERAMMAQENAR